MFVSAKPRLFNWVTIMLVSGWVLIVSVLTVQTEPVAASKSVDVFIEKMIN